MIRRVLVIDARGNAGRLCALLRQHALDVRDARDADDALGVLKDFVPDAAVVVDVDGGVAARFRALPSLADMWLIALGHAGEAYDVTLPSSSAPALLEALRNLPLLREPSRAVPVAARR